MNYFELHIGDYDKATAHLTACEDGMYGRLLRRYYDTEAPLCSDLKALQRFVRARSKEEQQAVQTVLEEFFALEADGWHHKRCDEEIRRYRDSEPDREAKRENERERQRRARERRRQIFEVLRGHGVVPEFDAPMSELQRLLSRVESQPVTPPVTRDVTATQTPDTRHQEPEEKRERAQPAGRGQRLPQGWTPEPVHMAFAETLGLRNGKAQAELEKFRDYWAAQPGQKGVKSDWPATWRNWVRRAVEASAGKPGAQGGIDFEAVH